MGNKVLDCVDQEFHVGHLLSNQRYLIDQKDLIVGLSAKTNCLIRNFPNVGILTNRTLFKSLHRYNFSNDFHCFFHSCFSVSGFQMAIKADKGRVPTYSGFQWFEIKFQ